MNRLGYTVCALVVVILFVGWRVLSAKQIKHIVPDDVIWSIAELESANNSQAFNMKTQAAGILQITPIMVREVNRISGKNFTNADRWSPRKSVKMFHIYADYWVPRFEKQPDVTKAAAMLWYGGSRIIDAPRDSGRWHQSVNYAERVSNLVKVRREVRQ